MTREKAMQYLAGWLLLSIFLVALFPHPDVATQTDIPRPGAIAAHSYIASVSFEVPKTSVQLKRERENAMKSVDAVFEYNQDATTKILADFSRTMKQIAEYGVLKARIAQTGKPSAQQALSQQLTVLQDQLSTRLSTTAIHYLSLHESARDTLALAFERLMNEGVSELLLASTQRQASLYQEYHNLSELKSILYSMPTVTLIRNGREFTLNTTKLRPREAVIEDAFAGIQFSAQYSQGLQSAFYEVLHVFTEPNIFYLDKETELRRQQHANLVNPSKGMVVKGMEIIAAGSIVTQDGIEKLEAMHEFLQKDQESRSALTSGFGQALFLLVLSAIFCLYLILLRSRTFLNIRHYWAIILIHTMQILLFFALNRLGQHLQQAQWIFPEGTDFIWLEPFVLAPILCTVLFHFRIGMISTLFCAIHLGMQSSYDLAVFLTALLVSWGAILFLHQIRYRSHFILSSLVGSLGLVVSVVMMLLLRNQMSWSAFYPPVLLGAFTILASVGISSLFLIHFFERSFGITTNLTLMELSDFNHPALKRLSERAPGSFHHSIMVGNLAEKAATRIGANPLLTRVIALYHDIGKSEHPEFFTENQKKGENPHDPLDPKDSTRIIRDHVVDGLRLAKEYKLPQRIADGIPEHHGDNIIHFFYRKALQLHLDQDIPASDFRYPGPRPQSRETALVMLADSIEATSRSMEDPDPKHLSKLVQDVIQTRLQEDQLRDSELSIHDLEEIEIGFLQSLEGMFHTRIQYPDGVFISSRKPA